MDKLPGGQVQEVDPAPQVETLLGHTGHCDEIEGLQPQHVPERKVSAGGQLDRQPQPLASTLRGPQEVVVSDNRLTFGSNVINIRPAINIQMPDLRTQPVGLNPTPSIISSPTPSSSLTPIQSPPSTQLPPSISLIRHSQTPEHDSEIYARLLLPKKHGWPLWYPRPLSNLPEAYRREGVNIGDVGIITTNGEWDYLWNIRWEAEDERNRGRVPTGFRPVEEAELSADPKAWKMGARVINGSIQIEAQLGSPTSFSFSCTPSEGAIAVLPFGGSRHTLLSKIDFEDYAGVNAEAWYKHVNTPRRLGGLGRGASNGSLYLVMGVDKTRSWGIASFADVSGDGSFKMNFCHAKPGRAEAMQEARERSDGEEPIHAYEWAEFGLATTDHEHVSSELDTSAAEDPPQENQCIFIRGFRVAVAESVWEQLFRPVGVESILDLTPRSLLARSSYIPFGGSSTGGGMASYFGLSRHASSGSNREAGEKGGIVMPDFPLPNQGSHPSDSVNAHLLKQIPSARVALTHDSVWSSVVEDGATKLPNPKEMIERLEERYEKVTVNGVVSFVLRGNSGGQGQDTPKASTTPDSPRRGDRSIIGALRRIKELVATVRDGLDLLPLETAISLLRHQLECDNYTQEARSILYHHLRRALLTRYTFFGYIEDLEGCFLGAGSDIVIAKGITGQDVEEVEEVQGAIQRIDECRQRVDSATLDTIICIAEESIQQPSTEGNRTLEQAELLILLGNALITKHLKCIGEQELSYAADKFDEAERLCVKNVSLAYISLTALAHIGWLRATECGVGRGLDDVKDCMRKAISLDEKGAELYTMGTKTAEAVVEISHLQRLQEAVNYLTSSLSCREHPHPQRSSTLRSLVEALWTRFLWVGDVKDLENVILFQREGLRLTFRRQAYCSFWLNNLANGLLTRFKKKGSFQDLEESILLHRETLNLFPTPQPRRAISLSNLAIALSIRSEQNGAFADLEECISLHREALDLRPPPDPDRPTSLNNLANALLTRFKKKGASQDIDESILLQQEVLKLFPSSHPHRPILLSNLAITLSIRSEKNGASTDLEECILLHREALDLRPPSHPDRSASLDNLANALSTRFERKAYFRDREEINLLRGEALRLRPSHRPDHATLNNISIQFSATESNENDQEIHPGLSHPVEACRTPTLLAHQKLQAISETQIH